MVDASRGIEITNLFVFGEKFPDQNDYNTHTRFI
ncbi:hypothetical protein Syn7502_01891 [Synechococcus sp. PCC 7502]|nr:hypothetical protein Syn7502_01891 [Synechococcus sp. PCC 7502]